MNPKAQDLLDAVSFHKQEAADCLKASESASGDGGWWIKRAEKHNRFASAIASIHDVLVNALHDTHGICGHCGKKKCAGKQSNSTLPDTLPTRAVLSVIQQAITPIN